MAAARVKKRNIRRPAAFIFSPLCTLHYRHQNLFCIYTHTHYFSDSAARQEQEAALRSGASCGPRQERRCASAGLMPPPALQQHKGPDPGTQKINVTQ